MAWPPVKPPSISPPAGTPSISPGGFNTSLGELVGGALRNISSVFSNISKIIGAIELITFIDYDMLFANETTWSSMTSRLKKFGIDYLKGNASTIANNIAIRTNIGQLMGWGRNTTELAAYIYEYGKEIFSKDKDMMFSFHINPVRTRNEFQKINTISEYGFGQYFVQNYGDKLVPITFEGTTGRLFPPNYIMRLGITDIRLSMGYFKLKKFEHFYRGTNKLFLVNYMGTGYFGFFEAFNYTFDANDPRQIKYTIQMKMDPNSQFSFYWGDMGSQMDNMRQTFSTSVPNTLSSFVN